MPIFTIPPVGPEDGGHIHEVVREIVGNRNYSTKPKLGEGHAARADYEDRGEHVGLRTRLRRLFRR